MYLAGEAREGVVEAGFRLVAEGGDQGIDALAEDRLAAGGMDGDVEAG